MCTRMSCAYHTPPCTCTQALTHATSQGWTVATEITGTWLTPVKPTGTKPQTLSLQQLQQLTSYVTHLEE